MLPFESNGFSKYGASMGRRSSLDLNTESKLHLRKVRIDSGGYDPGGAYWGIGSPLWCAWDAEGNTFYKRAPDRDSFKKLFPNAKFYR